MLSNYLSAALRNFTRNRTYSVIVTLSLAIGFAAMMLAAIYWRYEHSFDRFWPNGERVYLVKEKASGFGPPVAGMPTMPEAMWGNPRASMGALIARSVPGVEEVTRARIQFAELVTERTEARGFTAFVDGNFFDFFPSKVITGDIGVALRPGFAAITRSMAEKYYGRVDVVGQTLGVDRLGGPVNQTSVRIAAVIEDWPADSHIMTEVLRGGGVDADQPETEATTYVRMRKGVSEESLRSGLAALSRQIPVPPRQNFMSPTSIEFRPVPLRFAYNRPKVYGTAAYTDGRTAQKGLAEVFLGLGALMLAVSAINFVNLMTVRGAGRAVEVGVRKVVGARRRDLVAQFVGEGLIYAGLALVIALALVEVIRPWISATTGQPLPFKYGASLDLFALFVAGALAVGAVASLYPALVLSGVRPASAIRNEFAGIAGSSTLRQALVVLQFIPLLLLAGGGFGLYGQQQDYLANSMKFAPANALVVREPCGAALKDQVRSVPGVARVACLEMGSFRGTENFNGTFRDIGGSTPFDVLGPSGKRITKFEINQTDREALEYYDTRVLAGTLWSSTADARGVVLDQAAAKTLGYAPADAIGKLVTLRDPEKKQVTQRPVIGVISNRGGSDALPPSGYVYAPPASERKSLVAGVRFVEGADLVAATAAIDQVFKASTGRMPRRVFDQDELIEEESQQRTLQWVAAAVSVGLLMAVAGIFAMAVFLANRRTREIGIRKAFGASRAKLMRLLVFQFVKPVLIANLVAVPVLIWFSNEVARHMPADQRSTLAVSALATVVLGSLLITFLATFSQAWRVTGKLPLKALRSE